MTASAHALNHSTTTAILFFLVFLAISLGVTFIASRRTRSAEDFYTAGGKISPLQNGVALAGDFLAAAGMLGLSGLVSLYGADGFVLAIASVASWPLMLFLFAEPLRNIGRYTFADVLEFRLGSNRARVYAALCSVLTMLLLLAMQITGAGSLIKVLFGLPYEAAVAAVSAFVVIYVLFGGMLATTWVQIIKSALLVLTALALTGLVLARFGFNPATLVSAAAVRGGRAILGTGQAFPDPLELLSASATTMFGIAAFPHVLMRFFTVRDGAAARRSMIYAVLLVATVSTCTVFLGYGATAILGPQAIGAIDAGGNMAVPMLAEHFGGTVFLGFIGAVLFATIVATVSGMLLAGTAALSHDLWVNVVRRRAIGPREQALAPKVATVLLGIVTAGLGMGFKGQNVAIVSLFAATIPACTLFPVLVLAIYWRGLTTAGATAGLVGGLLATVTLVGLTPIVQVTLLGRAAAILPMQNVTIFALPLTFLVAMTVSLLSRSQSARDYYDTAVRPRIFAGSDHD
jgi:cation/acetate symporter